MNGCVVSLKLFLEVDLLPSLQVAQMGLNMLLQPRGKALETISSAHGKGMNLNYLPQ